MKRTGEYYQKSWIYRELARIKFMHVKSSLLLQPHLIVTGIFSHK